MTYSKQLFVHPGTVEIDRLKQEITGLFSLSSPAGNISIDKSSVNPAINLVETDEMFHLQVELPGVKTDELEISATGDLLTITGVRLGLENREGIQIYRNEITGKMFQKSLPLPRSVDHSLIEAEFMDGILTIMLPKIEEVIPRNIAVKSA